MIPLLQPSQFNGVPSVLSDSPEQQRVQTAQTQQNTQPTTSLRSAEEAKFAATLPEVRNDESSLPQLVDTVTALVKDLLKMLQGFITDANAQPREPANTAPLPTERPNEEPPLVIPVSTESPPLASPQVQTGPASTTRTGAEQMNPATTPTTDNNTGSRKAGSRKTGTTKSKKTSHRTSSKKTTINGRGQFLWKPKSDKDGKLAVLLPKEYTGAVKSLHVLDADAKSVLAEGKPAGVGNGGREHFRFDKSGAGFPDGCVVLVTLRDGSTRQIEIPNTSARFTR